MSQAMGTLSQGNIATSVAVPGEKQFLKTIGLSACNLPLDLMFFFFLGGGLKKPASAGDAELTA